MTRNREIVEAVTDELERAGAVDIKYRHEGRGHPRVWYTLGGKRLWYVVPGSTGDERRAAKNSRADVRRITGHVRPEKAASGPRRGRRRAARAPAPECPEITVKPDPWQALGALKAETRKAADPAPKPPLWRRLLSWLR